MKRSGNLLSKHKTKKFSRGASTISMQLIKNVFHPRENSISKIRGNFVIYILENNRIVSKERMLEVYLILLNGDPMYME
jgi:membrane peptidoglycan carboxypeptidase